MTIRSLVGNLGFVFKPFARISDSALYAVGYRENAEETGQPIPVNLAVKSALLIVPVYIVTSFLLMVILEQSLIAGLIVNLEQSLIAGLIVNKFYHSQFMLIIGFDYLVPTLWGTVGFLLAPLQVRRVLRLNRAARRHRLSDLERMAKREMTIQQNAPDLLRYEVQESPMQVVTGS